ncbi:DUF2382 domain-containing protein [Actinoplanes xinjiangensis]|jgi:uncharacterized protein (TIGR02271 family)|uniref:Uncharacterized protein (TIGR02271 family) n=1 Tax=Actinoplanes xinjiangensis TaxID=512350 RepID=A0A316EDT3_9ACTN|nr:PRC and DUF2382 domain-containing protein [Actinoplanes xinjiangensis]PWK29103.1 uncharacterized protein (TIGR02271 family) [Actinoplanes xinjiangensis]GIF45037.1 photosystem reaction center subunit H [Actinoplanes xinjiangensis]
MIVQEQVDLLYGREVVDRDGEKVGSVGAVWSDGAGQPTWASVKTGLFGLNESLLPLNDATLQGDRIVVPFEKAAIKDAPNVDASHDEPLSAEEVDLLYQHYGMSWDESYRTGRSSTATAAGGYTGTENRTPGTAVAGSRKAAGDDAMTRSEERLNVGTTTEQVGRARLRKYVVTEQQQVTVPVTHEEVRLEREPITAANRDAAYAGPDITESEHEVTLHAERPVVKTETVPVERVRLGTETVTEQKTVGGTVRKERIEADLPDEARRTID